MPTAKKLNLGPGDRLVLCPRSLPDMVDILFKSVREGVPLTPGQEGRKKMLLEEGSLVEVLRVDVPTLTYADAPRGTEVKYLKVGRDDTQHIVVGEIGTVHEHYPGFIPESWL